MYLFNTISGDSSCDIIDKYSSQHGQKTNKRRFGKEGLKGDPFLIMHNRTPHNISS